MKLKEFVTISWLVVWSGVEPGDGTTTTPIPSVVELAPPPEGAMPAFATSKATYSAHFRKKSGENKTNILKIRTHSNFSSLLSGYRGAKEMK